MEIGSRGHDRDGWHAGHELCRPPVVMGLAGGISGCRKIAAIAEAHHAPLVPHNFISPLLTAAAVHLDVAIPNFLTQEYMRTDESTRPSNMVFRTVVRRDGGHIPAPEAPGLGVEVDDALLAEAPPAYLPLATPFRSDGSPAFAV